MSRDLANVFRTREPFRQAGSDIDTTQPVRDHLAGEEVLLNERAERSANAILARGDDRRVRDGNAQWMPEERGDREPVSQTTDHRGFGGRPYDRDPRIPRLQELRDREDHGRRDEQHRRSPLHTVELCLTSRFVLQELHSCGAQPPRVTRDRSTSCVDAPVGTSTTSTTFFPSISRGVTTTVRPLPVYVRTPAVPSTGAFARYLDWIACPNASTNSAASIAVSHAVTHATALPPGMWTIA